MVVVVVCVLGGGGSRAHVPLLIPHMDEPGKMRMVVDEGPDQIIVLLSYWICKNADSRQSCEQANTKHSCTSMCMRAGTRVGGGRGGELGIRNPSLENHKRLLVSLEIMVRTPSP